MLLLALGARAAEFEASFEARDFAKGSLHSHTSASDGDAPAAAVALRYASEGFSFLALTDHDVLTPAPRAPGLVLIPGVEVTSWSRSEKKPVHANALCARKAVKGLRIEASVPDLLARTIALAREAGGLVLVNHPSFGRALSTDTLRGAPPFELLEIFSSHPEVPPGSAEEIWDALLTDGRRVLGAAVDDAHDFIKEGERRVPGGAWVELWGAGASARSACAALKEGRFYASSGARLERLSARGRSLELAVLGFRPEQDRVEFVGAGGRVLAVADRSPARYELSGAELYVRARVTQPGLGRAWTQAYFARQSPVSRP